MHVNGKGNTFWVALIVTCILSLAFFSGYLMGTTGEGSSNNVILGENSAILNYEEFNQLSYVVENEAISYTLDTYDYLFWKEKTTYYVKNGTTGNIEHFGTDLAELVEVVVSSSTDGLLLCFKPGKYFVFSTIDVFEKNDVRIMGAGKELTKFSVTSDITLFNVTGNTENHNMRFEISDCSLDGGSVLSTNVGLYIKHMDSIQLHDLDITCFDTHVYVEDCQKPNIYNLVVWSDQKFSYGLSFKGYNLDIKMHEVSVLHSDPDAIGILFDNYDSIELSKVYVNPTLTSTGTGSGFVFIDCHFVHLVDCIADGNGNAGYLISSGFGFYFSNCWSGSNLKGLLCIDADQIQINSCQFYSNIESGTKITSANENHPACSIVGSFFLHNKMYGLEVENTNHVTVSGNQFRNNTLYGIYFGEGNNYAIITNNDATENLHKKYDIYVNTPVSGSFLLLENNFGRVSVDDEE